MERGLDVGGVEVGDCFLTLLCEWRGCLNSNVSHVVHNVFEHCSEIRCSVISHFHRLVIASAVAEAKATLLLLTLRLVDTKNSGLCLLVTHVDNVTLFI